MNEYAKWVSNKYHFVEKIKLFREQAFPKIKGYIHRNIVADLCVSYNLFNISSDKSPLFKKL